MRYFYYDETTKVVTVAAEQSAAYGVLFGSVADSDFRQTHTTFLVQSLLTSAKIDAQGITTKVLSPPAVTPTSNE